MVQKQANPRAIVIAMMIRGVNQMALAEALGITQGAFSRLLSGDRYIKADTYLSRIADILDFPENFFFEDIKVLPRHLASSFRGLSVSQGEINRVYHKLFIHKHILKKLLEEVEVETDIPSYFNVENQTPEQIALYLRQRWNVPEGPIKNVINLVEKAGIYILWFHSSSEHLDSFVLPDEDGLPVIAVNKNMPPDKQRVAVVRELGHMFMHSGEFFLNRDYDYEGEANKFLAAFLLPKDDILPDLYSKTSFKEIINLKAHWKVPIAELIKRALELGAIDKSRFNSLNVQLSREGYKKFEPTFGIKREVPYLFKRFMDIHLSDLEFTKEELADKMNITLSDFNELYDLYTERLVKFNIIRTQK